MSLLSVDDALKAITGALTPLTAETVQMREVGAQNAVNDVLGRVLAEEITARYDHPPHDVSAMDGYAVRQADLNKGPLTVIGESAAGHPFGQSLQAGEAVRIFTGAYCPDGSETIIIQEDAEHQGTSLTITEHAPKGRYIRPKGNDFSSGDCLAQKGDVITSRLLALMASAGIDTFTLYPRPRVAIISTGDELVAPGMPTLEGQIVSSNGLFLKNFLTRIGADAIDLGIIKDNEKAIDQAFEDASSADLIITSGGASVGQHDGIAQAMAENGRTDTSLNFWRVAMRPGKPLIFGNIKGTPMLGLPGNPVSTGVCAIVFASAAIKAMTGQDLSRHWGMDIRKGRLGQDLNANDKRQEYLRATLDYDDDGVAIVTPFSQQDSGMMQHFTNADVLVIRPAFADAAKAGDQVSFIPIPDGI